MKRTSLQTIDHVAIKMWHRECPVDYEKKV